MESDIMFNGILPCYKTKYNIIISLHDGIYTINNTITNIYKIYIKQKISSRFTNIFNNIKETNNKIIYIINYYLCGVNCLKKLVPG